ncbi:hypothetical protein GCM10010335_36530 [Streptomyces galbus]|nr:hypothetical protein GCM10010335_36530 [Streptomyces galbus]
MSRCTPTGLSHAVRVSVSQSKRNGRSVTTARTLSAWEHARYQGWPDKGLQRAWSWDADSPSTRTLARMAACDGVQQTKPEPGTRHKANVG